MGTWRVSLIAGDGRTEVALIDAPGRDEALALAAAKPGVTPFDATEGRVRKKAALKRRDLGLLIDDLSALTMAHVPLPEALATIEKSARRRSLCRAAGLLDAEIRGGVSLSEAFEGALGAPAEVTASIAAGEQSGDLSGALCRLATAHQRRETVRRALTGALIYPAILLVVTILSLGVILLGVVPGLAPLIAGAGGTAPTSARLLVTLSEGLGDHGPLVGVVVLLVFLGAFRLAHAAPRQAQLLLMQLPVMGRVLRAAETANAFRSVAGLVASRTPLPDALSIAARAAQTLPVKDALSAVADDVREGREFAAAYQLESVLDQSVGGMLEIGTRTGRLSEMMLAGAVALERDVDLATQRIIAVLPPIMTLVLGGLVGGVSAIILSAIVSVNDIAI